MNQNTSKSGGLVAGNMQGSSITMPISSLALNAHICAAVHMYAMNTTLFYTDVPTTETLCPSTFALYLFGVAMTHVSNTGILGGTGKNDICRDLDEYQVPVGFAKYLEHLGAYQSGSFEAQSSYNLSTGLAVSTQGWSHVAGSVLGLVVPGGSNITYFTASTGGGAVGEYVYSDNALATSVTLPSLWSTVAIDISQGIASAGLSCIKYKDIPKIAPNSSAYTNIVDQLGGGETGNIALNNQVVGISPDFNAEEALLFSVNRNLTQKFTLPFMKSLVMPQAQVILDSSATANSQIDSRFGAPFFNAWIGARQTVYRKGPVLKSYRLCESKVRHLVFSYQKLDSGSLFRIAYRALNEFMGQVNTPIADLDTYRLTYLYFQVLFHMVTARLVESSPIPTLSFTNATAAAVATAFSPQSFFVTRAWLGLPVPAVIARYVDSIGPVNLQGRIIVPYYGLSGSDGNRYPYGANGTSYPGFAIGQSVNRLGFPGGVFGQNGITASSGTVPASYSFSPQGTVLTNADLIAYYPNGLAFKRNGFWNANAAYFAGLWDRLHKKYLGGSALSSSMIHTHNPPCGAVTALLTTVAVQVQDANTYVPDPDVGGFFLTYQDYEAFSVGSFVDLASDEVIEAVIFRFSTVDLTSDALALARFRYQLPVTSASTMFLTDYCQKTFSPESSFSKALSVRQSKFDPVARSIKGIDLVRVEEMDGCYVRDLLKGVGREIFSAARFAAPVALGTLCSPGGPMASKLCASLGDNVIKSIGSFLDIEADGHPPVNRKDIKMAIKSAKATAGIREISLTPGKPKKLNIKPVGTKSKGKQPAKAPKMGKTLKGKK